MAAQSLYHFYLVYRPARGGKAVAKNLTRRAASEHAARRNIIDEQLGQGRTVKKLELADATA
jgi:hypothetical protein